MFKGLFKKSCLPTLFVIGAQKSGTGSLHYYLTQHPNIFGAKKKELHYFDDDDLYNEDLIWYRKQFTFSKLLLLRKNIITLDSTPNYIYHPNVIQRIANYNPSSRFIAVFRNPIDRAFSAWNMYKQLMNDDRLVETWKEKNSKNYRLYDTFYQDRKHFPDFDACIQMELEWIKNKDEVVEPSLIRRGFYKQQLEQWFKVYDNRQFFFLLDYELEEENVLDTINRIFEFLSLKKMKAQDFSFKKVHVRTKEETIQKSTREMLKTIYLKENNGIDELINKDCSCLF